VVDATVIVTALTHGAIVFTGDDGDLKALAAVSGARPAPVIWRI
jgi:hypothetical protein